MFNFKTQIMLPFRSEIRNAPQKATIKIFLSDASLVQHIKTELQRFNEVEMIELRESVGRNRVKENITIFFKDDVDINRMKTLIDNSLANYFENGLVK